MVLAGSFIRDSARENVAESRRGAGSAKGRAVRRPVEVCRGVRLDGWVLHLHIPLWRGRWLLVRRCGHHDGSRVGALLLLLGHLWCERGKGGAGVVDECYAEHLGLAPWGWGRLLHWWWCLLEALATDGLGWWGWWGGVDFWF